MSTSVTMTGPNGEEVTVWNPPTTNLVVNDNGDGSWSIDTDTGETIMTVPAADD